jgi:hypothetical protein
MKTKITPQDVQDAITATYYFTAADLPFAAGIEDKELHKVTFCLIVLKNGTKVTGVNYGAIDNADHDPEIGRRRAKDQALDKVYELLGYELRTAIAYLKPLIGSCNAPTT